ncbi:hypothetical protein GCM10012275_15380 [Longimycelium tulufanense]|uniref:Lsr2 family protein n=1 Tax=Longimycelium tulufanense TaxID=907463 RepID=A0A8J3FTX7_9PSEU|nr:hypothetical protein GCM10012275_15380 [Longimycelium tulufanense]
MATKVVLIDDLNPELEADETVRFGLDGQMYEIDLTEEHADALRAALAEFVTAARRLGGRKVSSAPDRGNQREVRAWARSRGLKVSDRGRIPRDVMLAYEREASAQVVPLGHAHGGEGGGQAAGKTVQESKMRRVQRQRGAAKRRVGEQRRGRRV